MSACRITVVAYRYMGRQLRCVIAYKEIQRYTTELVGCFSPSNRTNDTIIQPSQIRCLSSFVTMLSRFLGFDTNTQRPENWDKVARHCAASFYWLIHNGNTTRKYAANGYRVDRILRNERSRSWPREASRN